MLINLYFQNFRQFLLEQILYCVLTHKFLSIQRSLLLTLELLKILDPCCTKIHIVIPLLVRYVPFFLSFLNYYFVLNSAFGICFILSYFSASGVEQRLEILAHFLSIGYNNLSHLNYGVIRKLVLQPLLSLIFSFYLILFYLIKFYSFNKSPICLLLCEMYWFVTKLHNIHRHTFFIHF